MGTPLPVNIAVGKRIRLRRMELEMTQENLARAVGVTGAQINYWETGQQTVKVSQLEKLAFALKAPMQWFFGETKESVNSCVDSFFDRDGMKIAAAVHARPELKSQIAALVQQLSSK